MPPIKWLRLASQRSSHIRPISRIGPIEFQFPPAYTAVGKGGLVWVCETGR
jgi:hypothetical protein